MWHREQYTEEEINREVKKDVPFTAFLLWYTWGHYEHNYRYLDGGWFQFQSSVENLQKALHELPLDQDIRIYGLTDLKEEWKNRDEKFLLKTEEYGQIYKLYSKGAHSICEFNGGFNGW